VSKRALVARCPAKVNLGLRVLGRRPDGLHELETVFQAVNLWDRLEVRPAKKITLSCDDPTLPVDDTNLVIRAARLFQEHVGIEGGGATFQLSKKIPVGGGLGGGSSDAAGAILLLSQLGGSRTSGKALSEMARVLGADVPFFLCGGTALGRGRGDRIHPMAYAGDLSLLLGCPPFGLSTAEIYQRFDRGSAARASPGELRLTLPENDVSVTGLSALKLPGGNDFGVAVNDLEGVVFQGWPGLRAFRDALLEAGARRALLSGSGSTVFGIFKEPGHMNRAASVLEGKFPEWTLRPCRTIRGAVHIAGEAGGAR